MPLSLIRKKWVPCALSGLPAVRPAMFRFGLAMIGSPSRGSVNGRSGIVRPVQPVTRDQDRLLELARAARAARSTRQLIEPAVDASCRG